MPETSTPLLAARSANPPAYQFRMRLTRNRQSAVASKHAPRKAHRRELPLMSWLSTILEYDSGQPTSHARVPRSQPLRPRNSKNKCVQVLRRRERERVAPSRKPPLKIPSPNPDLRQYVERRVRSGGCLNHCSHGAPGSCGPLAITEALTLKCLAGVYPSYVRRAQASVPTTSTPRIARGGVRRTMWSSSITSM
jgi:hypothetical protein